MQMERTGCGIASAAAIAGVSYAKAKSAAAGLGIFATDERLWSESVCVRRLLNRFGFKTGLSEIPFRSWDSLPDLALLAIKWHQSKARAFWHWVVFVRDEKGARVLDSRKTLRSNIRTDFGRMKPRWYITVKAGARHGRESGGNIAIA